MEICDKPIVIDPVARAKRIEGLNKLRGRYDALRRGHLDIVERLRNNELDAEELRKIGIENVKIWWNMHSCSDKYCYMWNDILTSSDLDNAIEKAINSEWGNALMQNSALFSFVKKEYLQESHDVLFK